MGRCFSLALLPELWQRTSATLGSDWKVLGTVCVWPMASGLQRNQPVSVSHYINYVHLMYVCNWLYSVQCTCNRFYQISLSLLVPYFPPGFSCGRLDNPENGQVTVSGVSAGSNARYRCNTGFELVGAATRICLQTGQWSGSAPSCQGEFESL